MSKQLPVKAQQWTGFTARSSKISGLSAPSSMQNLIHRVNLHPKNKNAPTCIGAFSEPVRPDTGGLLHSNDAGRFYRSGRQFYLLADAAFDGGNLQFILAVGQVFNTEQKRLL